MADHSKPCLSEGEMGFLLFVNREKPGYYDKGSCVKRIRITHPDITRTLFINL